MLGAYLLCYILKSFKKFCYDEVLTSYDFTYSVARWSERNLFVKEIWVLIWLKAKYMQRLYRDKYCWVLKAIQVQD